MPGVQFQLDDDEHGRTFRDPALLKTLGTLLGVSPAMLAVIPTPPIRVRLPKAVFAISEAARINIEVMDASSAGLVLEIYPIAEDGSAAEPMVSLSVTPANVASKSVVVEAKLPGKPGLYGARAYSADRGNASEQEGFAVQAAN